MEYPCVALGKFGRKPVIPIGLCLKGRHRATIYSVGRTAQGTSFCRPCQEARQAKWYWARRLELYWAAMGLKLADLKVPITSGPSPPILLKENDRMAEFPLQRPAHPAACLTAEAAQHSHCND